MNHIPDNVSKYDNVYDVLKERGFIEQTTDDEGIRKLLGEEKIKFYIGFDPTADCLHVGHFMQVIIMMYMQNGHDRRSLRPDRYETDDDSGYNQRKRTQIQGAV